MRRRRRGLLRMYYGVDDSVQLQQDNPLDIDKAGFKADMFMEKMLKETSLNNLYKQEERMKKGIIMVYTHLLPYTHTLCTHTLCTHLLPYTHTLCTHTLSTHTYYPIPIPSTHTLTTLYPYPRHTHLLPCTHTLCTHFPIPIPIPLVLTNPPPHTHTHQRSRSWTATCSTWCMRTIQSSSKPLKPSEK